LTAIRSATGCGLGVDRDERQGAHRERRRDQILEIFHRFLHP
jgi:hypothetical protein